MKHLLRPLVFRCLCRIGSLVLLGATAVVLTGCAGFTAPDARMSRPEPELLSSRGVLPPPQQLGGSQKESASEQRVRPAGGQAKTSRDFGDGRHETAADEMAYGRTRIEDLDIPYTQSERSHEFGDAAAEKEYTSPEITPLDTADAGQGDEQEILPDSPEAASSLSHTVRKGESLWSISRRYGVSVGELASYNDMDEEDVLLTGTTLEIPPGGTTPEDAQPASSRQEDPASESVDSSVAAITPDGRESIPDDGKYIVKSGDSLWKISRRFGVSIEDLRRWNDMEDSDVLQIGRTLLLRSPGAVGTRDREARGMRGAPTTPERTPREEDLEADEQPDEGQRGGRLDEEEGRRAPETVTFPQTLEHTVSRGESLTNIADMYETSVEAILKANPHIRDDDDLDPGKQLVIPFE